MTDIYAWWRQALLGNIGEIHADNPQAGRFKMKRGGIFVPVAIGPDEHGHVTALMDGASVDPATIWTFCSKHPVSQDDYKFRKANGHWPDEPAPLPKSNMPSDPLEALLQEIEDKSAQAEAYLIKNPEIKNQQVCDLFRNMQAQLLALKKRGDGLFEVEKRPILDATAACDDKYRFRAAVAVLATRLRQRYEAFMQEEEDRLKKEAAEKFRAEQERVRKEQERILAEAKKQMEDDPVRALTSDPVEMPELPLAPEPVHVSAGGGVGRKAGLRTVYLGEITDFEAVVQHFIGHEDLKEVVNKLVARAVKAGGATTTIPGVKIKEERKAA